MGRGTQSPLLVIYILYCINGLKIIIQYKMFPSRDYHLDIIVYTL